MTDLLDSDLDDLIGIENLVKDKFREVTAYKKINIKQENSNKIMVTLHLAHPATDHKEITQTSTAVCLIC